MTEDRKLEDRLRAGLEGATSGPWASFYKPKYDEWHVALPTSGSGMKLALCRDGIQSENREADAKHIANCSPENIAALLDSLAFLRGKVEELEANHRAYETIIGPYTYQEVASDLAALQSRALELERENETFAALIRDYAAMERPNFIDELAKERDQALAKVERLERALREMVYETTHLSPERDDGSHDCRISKASLENARRALSQEVKP